MNATSIALRAVTRRYGKALALDAVSVSAPAGQVLALLGASGSGKSTILRLIAGLERPDAGAIAFGDDVVSDVNRFAPAEIRRIGVVFQDYALFPHLSVVENVMFGVADVKASERQDIARRWLAKVGLSARAKSYPHELSGGEQQRVALARAMAPNPRAVLFDEPFSGLDPGLRMALRDTTLEAVREAGATAVFVTHDAEEAMQIADSLVILQAGRVLMEADPRRAYDFPVSPAAAAALGPVNSCASPVHNGKAMTPFGAVEARDFTDGAQVRIVVRAEAVNLLEGDGAIIREVRPYGANDMALIEAQGLRWKALAPRRSVVLGPTKVALDASGVFVFAEEA